MVKELTIAPSGQVRSEYLGKILVLVIVVVPVVFVVPRVGVFVPSLVFMIPAIRPRSCQFLAPMLGVRAVRSVLFDSVM